MPLTEQSRRQSPIILSHLVDSYRSTGNIYDSGVPSTPYSYYNTAFVSAANYDAFVDFAAKNSGTLNRAGAMSLDGMFIGYTTDFDETGVLPHFTRPTNSGAPNSISLNPFNPDYKFGDLGIQTTGTAAGSVSGVFNTGVWESGGHTIRAAHTLSTFTTEGGMQSGLYPMNSNFDSDFYARKKTELKTIRAVGLRAPLVVGGWGRDTNGNPVPSGEGGSGLHPNALVDQSLWKVGPVDLRWSEERGVWVAGGGGAEIIRFSITDVGTALGQNAAGCEEVTVTVNEVGCSTTSASVGDTGVKVYDDDLCFFNLPISLLIGMKGTAQKFTNPFTDPEATGDCYAEAYAQGACRWVVTGLCCGEEIV
jgi:hypothetical protein